VAVILLVTSDAASREGWEADLGEAGHVVLVTATAAAALSQLLAGGIDVVIAEYEVAGGLAPLTSALGRLPDRPPLVLLSGAADAPAVSAHVGAAAFVMKPCSGSELAAIVKKQMEGPMPLDMAPTGPISRP